MPTLTPQVLALCPDFDTHLWCSGCKVWLPDDSFSKHKAHTHRRGRQPNCRACAKVFSGKCYEGTRQADLMRKYGISAEQRDHMAKVQDYKCWACGLPEEEARYGSLAVDHCHATGQVRRLLCNICNLALGMLKDNPQTLRRLADMVDEFKGVTVHDSN